jgi:hypothetical protein
MGKRAVILSALLALLASLLLSGGAEVVPVTGDRSNEVASRVAEAFHSTTESTRPPPGMCPCSVDANLTCAAGCPCGILRSLYGPHRVGVRLVMILLSARGQTADAIAGVLGCDASTVRRWIHRYHQHGIAGLCDQPRPGRPRLGGPWSTQRILRLVAEPRRGRSLGSTSGLAAPGHEPCHLPAQGARGGRVEAVLASLHQRPTELPEDAVVLAEDETHLHLLPWVRANR